MSTKLPQFLAVEPQQELKFKGPFKEVVSAELTLTNLAPKKICFKVKTTAPKQYCVRPNNGVIEPGGKVAVSVMLQPFQYDPNEKNRHKFLVQSLVVPDGVKENLETLWKDMPADQLMESKLKCVFEVDAETLQNINLQKMNGANKLSISPFNKGTRSEVVTEEEIKQEMFHLREENAKLKDEGLRLRRSHGKGNVSPLSVGSASAAIVSLTQQWSWATMCAVMLLVVISLVLGLAIGKFMM